MSFGVKIPPAVAMWLHDDLTMEGRAALWMARLRRPTAPSQGQPGTRGTLSTSRPDRPTGVAPPSSGRWLCRQKIDAGMRLIGRRAHRAASDTQQAARVDH